MKDVNFRINNVVLYCNVLHRIEAIDEDSGVKLESYKDYYLGYFVWFDDIKPVEITEEYLLKFGFCKRSAGILTDYSISIESEYSQTNIRASFKNGKFERCMLYDIDDGSIGLEIIYVHQLQNLYFALTGKELSI